MPRALLSAVLLAAAAFAGDPSFGVLAEGGPVAPDGKTQVACDVPVELRQKNTGGRDGAGLCVFTSIEHAARYQNEHRLWNFQRDMTGEPGGGYPQKVDAMIRKYGPGTRYIQHTGGDLEFLRAAIATGRCPGVTYAGRDMHYGSRSRIAHMVNLVYLDQDQACILDNNFIGANQLVWMNADEFRSRWLDMSGGWAVVILTPPPPPVPRP